MAPNSSTDAQAINLRWLIRLRWVAFAGQCLVFWITFSGMDIPLPLRFLAVVLGIGVVSNFSAMLWQQTNPSVHEWQLSILMFLDILLLTAVLYATGGPYNPFSSLYLVNIALAAVSLSFRWSWALVAAAVLCFGGLFQFHQDLPHLHEHETDNLHLHLQGMWVSFGITAGFIVYFVHRVVRALQEKERELNLTQAKAARYEKLTSLATLAAGAAHEFSTPMSTIAVAAKEVERALHDYPNLRPSVQRDLKLIREELERCKEILNKMSLRGGMHPGEVDEKIRVDELLRRAMDASPDSTRIQYMKRENLTVNVPPDAMARAIRDILKNALEASESLVKVTATQNGTFCRLNVIDQGGGMTTEILSRVGEPFFTTKEPGKGLGLGLFLARSIVEQAGGKLEIDSTFQKGTVVRLFLPCEAHKQ